MLDKARAKVDELHHELHEEHPREIAKLVKPVLRGDAMREGHLTQKTDARKAAQNFRDVFNGTTFECRGTRV
jgi:hypothetical protein